MASYLQVEGISKSYGPKVLFHNIGFNINEGDKIALIAPNGSGKTSLLRILSGDDKSDSGGKITFLRQIRIAFLQQEYAFDPGLSIFAQVMQGSQKYMQGLDSEHIFDYELRVRQLITDIGLGDGSKKMASLSGGEVKRVALVEMLSSQAEFLIMDEPTNHLDIDAIEYLESYLKRSRCTLLMVTHDRYFLDSVCNQIIELDHGAAYIYKGNYAAYLEKRQERIDNYNAETDKVRNLLRRELEWMHSTPQARTGKARYRINAFYELQDRASQQYRSQKLDMSLMGQGSRLGSKIINCRKVSFHYGERCLLNDFTYNFQRFEKVGIVGANGSGKTTFLSILTGAALEGGTLTGMVDRGESLKIGWYRQGGMKFDEEQTVLETVPDTHLLSRFLFPHDMLNTRVGRLSGGERRRLYLLTILMQNPNLLILDEPTNDLDIVTLNVLEEYLLEFQGSLIVVSHDRHFLDRIVDHLFVFCGDGVVKDFVGSYSEYREFIREYEARRKAESRQAAKKEAPARTPDPNRAPERRKLSFKEKREMETLEKEIEELGAEKASLEEKLSRGNLPFTELEAASKRFSEISTILDEKETRWLELSMI